MKRSVGRERGFRLSLVFLCFAALILTTTGLGVAQTPLKVLTVSLSVDARSLDPYTDITSSSESIYSQIFSQLWVRDDNMDLSPSVATAYRLINDTTWEFDIRKGVLFHNGDELTAQDVVFSTNRVLDPSKGFAKTPKISPAVESVEAVDRYTVRFHTKGIYVTFLDILEYIYILPEAVVRGLGDTEFSLHPVGSGPFKFVSWERDRQLVLDAFDKYWAGRPLIDRLIFKPIAETSTRIAALLTGETDLIVNVPPEMVAQIEQNKDLRVVECYGGRDMFVGITNTNPPLDDVRVRKALNYAIDKEGVIAQVLGGHASMHGKLFAPQIFGDDPSLPQPYPYDPAKAKALLAEAGFTAAKPLKLEFEAPRGRYMKDAEIAEAIAYQLQNVGIDVRLTTEGWATFWSRVSGHQMTGLWFMGNGGFFDAAYLYELYLSSQGRKLFIPTPEVDQLVVEQRTILDRAQREKALQKLMAMYHDLAPWILLWNQNDFYAVNKRVLNWSPRYDEYMRLLKVDVAP